MTDFFNDKNILALYPAEDSGFPMRFYPLKNHSRSLHLLNYTEACHTEGIKNTEQRIRDIIAGENIGIVICCPFASEYQLSVAFFSSLRKKAKIIFWFADDATYFESYNRYYAQAADAVISTDYFTVFAYKRLEIPAVVSQDLTASNRYFPVKTEKDIDICFIGDMRKRGRREYIEFLRSAGISVTVYGQGAETGYLPSEKISEYFCRSRINLNFTQISVLDWKNSDEPLLNRVRQNTGRAREIALTGAFCLSEYFPSIETVFSVGREIDFFRDKAELLEKVRFYLANPEKRDAMALAAHNYAVKNYREDIYIPRMLNELVPVLSGVGSHDINADKIYLSRIFKVREINSLTFSMFILAKNHRFKQALEAFLLLFKHGPVIFLSGFSGGMGRVIHGTLGKLTGKSRSRVAAAQ